MSPTTEGEWVFNTFADGTEQYGYIPPNPPYVFIERVVGPHSIRKLWYIVDRREGVKGRDDLYPPRLSGPYRKLDQAKAVFLILMAAGQFA